MSESYAAMFHCDEGDDPNWTDFSVGAASTSGLNDANPLNLETSKAGGGDCEEGVSVKIEEDDVYPPGDEPLEAECPVKVEEESLRDVVNFKEVVGTYKIFVSCLPSTATNEHLREMFAPYGTVLDCEVFQHKNYAFVHMDSVASGNDAVKDLNGVELDGSAIRVQRSTSFPVQSSYSQEVGTFKLFISQLKDGVTKEEVKEILEPYGRIVDIEIYRSSNAFVHMEEESAGRLIIKKLNNQTVPGSDGRLGISESKNPEGPNVPTITIHVKNFGAHVTAEKMRSLFQSYGLVLRCTITDQHVDLLRKAIVLFEQLGDVRSAINELNNFELDGQKLSVKPVFDEPSLPTPPVKKPPPLLSTPTTGFGGQRGSVAASPAGRGRGRGSPSFSRGMGRGVGNVPFSQQPTSMHSNRGGGGGSIASAGGRGNFQLIPMPSKQEINQANRNRGNFSRGRGGIRGSRGFSRGQSRGNYQNQGFDQDTYDFDEYYQDPKVALSREHLSEFQNSNKFEPPQKIAKVQPHNFQSNSGQPQALMGIDFHSDTIEDQLLPQQKSATQSYEQLYPQRQNQVQSLFPTNPNYFSSDQIAGSSTNNSNFDGNSSTSGSSVGVAAYPANYYAGVAGYNLNAVPFDYSNLRRGRGGGVAGTGVGRGGGGKQLELQTEFPPGVNPADYPDLKPGSKVYINGRGKVMVRGVRIKPKGRPRPGLGSKGGSNKGGGGFNNSGASTSNGGPSFSGGNQTPVAVAGPSTSYPKTYNQFGAKKKQFKEDNQEYTEWLQQKSWLYTPIQGIVKPASK